MKVPTEYHSSEALADAYREGWQSGHGLACDNKPTIGDRIDPSIDWVGLGRVVTAENAPEYHELLCIEAERYGRQFSPFECAAHQFNRYGDGGWRIVDADDDISEAVFPSFDEARAAAIAEDCPDAEIEEVPSADEAWEAYEAGVADAVREDLRGYSLSDYGCNLETCGELG